MTQYLVMKMINIHQAKAQLSHYLGLVEQGERVVICRRNVPIAELRALPRVQARAREIGRMKGRVQVPDAFFEPLPEELLRACEGRDD